MIRMDIFSFIGNIFNPAATLIDKVHTSEAEKLELKNEFTIIKNKFAERILEYDTKLLKAQADMIKSEAKGHSWLQRNWRPITMITFLFLVVFDCIGLLKFRLSAEAWHLLQIGLGGYVIGRSAEKVAPQIIDKLKK